jgi:hypothetical protein
MKKTLKSDKKNKKKQSKLPVDFLTGIWQKKLKHEATLLPCSSESWCHFIGGAGGKFNRLVLLASFIRICRS